MWGLPVTFNILYTGYRAERGRGGQGAMDGFALEAESRNWVEGSFLFRHENSPSNLPFCIKGGKIPAGSNGGIEKIIVWVSLELRAQRRDTLTQRSLGVNLAQICLHPPC